MWPKRSPVVRASPSHTQSTTNGECAKPRQLVAGRFERRRTLGCTNLRKCPRRRAAHPVAPMSQCRRQHRHLADMRHLAQRENEKALLAVAKFVVARLQTTDK